jgi:hypothetical protein
VVRNFDAAGALVSPSPMLTIRFPDQAIVECDIPGVNLKVGQPKPKRQVWHGEVQFEDGQPATDLEHGVSTTITLWEKDSPDGFPLDKVTIKGFFQGVFSEEEMAALKEGRNWLTMTVGNWAVKAKKDDPRFDTAKLMRGQFPLNCRRSRIPATTLTRLRAFRRPERRSV